jgi:peptidoglycan/xylan/chitin deacetylase (PgdA/CDA1 family)
MRTEVTWRWPKSKRVVVCFNLCVEGWSDGVAPGISPMGNPLPAGVLDSTAISWAAYGAKDGVYRIIDELGSQKAKGTFLVNGVIAERQPDAVKAIVEAGHEVAAHSFAMDVIPGLLSEPDERKNIERTTSLLENAGGVRPRGWISPRATSSPLTPRLLAEAGYKWYGDLLDRDLPSVLPYANNTFVGIPLHTDVNDMPFMKYGNPPKLMLEAFEENLEVAVRSKSRAPVMIDVTLHAHIFGRPRGAYFFGKIVARAAKSRDVWIGTREQIAEHVLAHVGGMAEGAPRPRAQLRSVR